MNILNGETFNMFYISPYFISELPVFDTIQKSVPYIVFLSLYVFAITMGASLIYGISYIIKNNILKLILTKKEKILKGRD